MAECVASTSSESFGTPGSPPATPSDVSDQEPIGKHKGSAISGSFMRKLKKRRPNTPCEKRAMRRERKKRMRKMKKKEAHAKRRIQDIKQECDKHKTETVLYKQMARDYWDRWQWELHKRKEEMYHQKRASRKVSDTGLLHQIDPSQLSDPIQGDKPTEVYIGRGSFSIVRLKVYRGIYVAVKQFRTRSVKSDVHNEAVLLSSVCHPYLPYLFGVCTTVEPYRIITQFHGIDHKTVTLQREIHDHSCHLITNSFMWIILCSQLLDAVNYLHCDARLLHNDIKADNVLLAQGSEQETSQTSSTCLYHVVLTDFGKATHVECGRHYSLSESDRAQYRTNFPHLAPEVINGDKEQTVMSDMYAVGILFNKMLLHGCFSSISEQTVIRDLINQCKSVDLTQRPTAKQCIEVIQKLM